MKKGPPDLHDLEYLTGVNCLFNKILFVHRPEYYKIDLDGTGESTENKLYLHILRNADGKRDIIRLNFKEGSRFLLEDEDQIHFN